MIRLSSCFVSLLLATLAVGVPQAYVIRSGIRSEEETTPQLKLAAIEASSASTAPAASETVPVISLDPNDPVWDASSNGPFESIRGKLGASIIGPNNPNIAVQNPDLFAPPSTDAGSV
jgi:hypothetical protein